MTEDSKPLKIAFSTFPGRWRLSQAGRAGLGLQIAEALGEFDATVIITAPQAGRARSCGGSPWWVRASALIAFQGRFSGKPESIAEFTRLVGRAS